MGETEETRADGRLRKLLSVCQTQPLSSSDGRKEIQYRIIHKYSTICALWKVAALMNRLIMSPFAGSDVGLNRHIYFIVEIFF